MLFDQNKTLYLSLSSSLYLSPINTIFTYICVQVNQTHNYMRSILLIAALSLSFGVMANDPPKKKKKNNTEQSSGGCCSKKAEEGTQSSSCGSSGSSAESASSSTSSTAAPARTCCSPK